MQVPEFGVLWQLEDARKAPMAAFQHCEKARSCRERAKAWCWRSWERREGRGVSSFTHSVCIIELAHG